MSITELYSIIENADSRILKVSLGNLNHYMYGTIFYNFGYSDSPNYIYLDIPLENYSVDLSTEYTEGYSYSGVINNPIYGSALISLTNTLRMEFLCKCCLKGNTPVFSEYKSFNVDLSHELLTPTESTKADGSETEFTFLSPICLVQINGVP